MSTRRCPFWCLVHGDGLSVADRPHESASTVVDGTHGESVRLTLLQAESPAWPWLELEVNGHAVAMTVDAGQTLISGLRALAGMAMRSQAVTR